jgi:hypothetical protein
MLLVDEYVEGVEDNEGDEVVDDRVENLDRSKTLFLQSEEIKYCSESHDVEVVLPQPSHLQGVVANRVLQNNLLLLSPFPSSPLLSSPLSPQSHLPPPATPAS